MRLLLDSSEATNEAAVEIVVADPSLLDAVSALEKALQGGSGEALRRTAQHDREQSSLLHHQRVENDTLRIRIRTLEQQLEKSTSKLRVLTTEKNRFGGAGHIFYLNLRASGFQEVARVSVG